MAIMKVLDKTTDKHIAIKIDVEDLDRLQKYNYVVDQHHTKPFREEKIGRFVRRIFLARDVMGFSFGDKRVVSYKDGDIYNCTKANLVEGRTTVVEQKSNAGNFWPHTFKSLVNFLDKRKGEDEQVAVVFLLKATKTKYTRKRIDLIFEEADYNDYKNKNIQLTIMRVLNKHFEWGGQVVAAKDLTKQMQHIIEIKKKEKEKEKEKEKRIIEVKEKGKRKEVVKETNLDLPTWDKWEANFKKQSETNKQKLIELVSKYLPIEDLLEIVMEKGSTPKMAMTVQFVRKA
jgi:hypothetical protein